MEIKERTERARERVLALIKNEFDSDASFERELGLPTKTVNNWRRGRSASFMKMLPRLAEAFEVNVSELLDIPIRRDTSELSEDEIELLSLYRKACILPQKQKSALHKTLGEVINLYINSMPQRASSKKKKDTE